MKTWIKGGLWGLGIYIILAISNITPIINLLFSIQAFFGNLLLGSSTGGWEVLKFAYLFSFLIAPLIWFLIGALIGFIVGKIKSKSKKNKK